MKKYFLTSVIGLALWSTLVLKSFKLWGALPARVFYSFIGKARSCTKFFNYIAKVEMCNVILHSTAVESSTLHEIIERMLSKHETLKRMFFNAKYSKTRCAGHFLHEMGGHSSFERSNYNQALCAIFFCDSFSLPSYLVWRMFGARVIIVSFFFARWKFSPKFQGQSTTCDASTEPRREIQILQATMRLSLSTAFLVCYFVCFRALSTRNHTWDQGRMEWALGFLVSSLSISKCVSFWLR